MRRVIIAAAAAALLQACHGADGQEPAPRIVEVGPGYSQTSVNTAVFRASSIVSMGDQQYISYYDPDGRVTLAKRTLGADKWTVERTQYTGRPQDAHNVISMGIDGEGRLHLAFDHHGDTLNYCRGVAPGLLQMGPVEPMTGIDEDNVTYPEFYSLPGGDLLFAYRSGASGRGNLVLNRYSVENRRWSRVQDALIDGEDQRSAYWQICVDASGVIHISWVWRETWLVETNHDLCYARSADGGVTWQNSRGETYRLPITASNAEVACQIPQNSELINQTGMCADSAGTPYIASYWRDPGSDTPQYRLVWLAGGGWRVSTVTSRATPFTLSGGGTKMIPIARPRVVARGKELFYLMRDVERGRRVSMARTSHVESGQWTVTDLTSFSVDAWEPTLDTQLWDSRHLLHIFVQRASQGDGERAVETEPQPVCVLEAL